jgi:hypothetical protein
VVAWGEIASGVPDVPAEVTNVVAIGAGPSAGNALAVRSDGTVVVWAGDWSWIVPDLTNAIAVAAGRMHSLAIRADHTLVTWGENFYGQCTIPSGLTNVTAIAAGMFHSLALDPAGGVIRLTADQGSGSLGYVQVHLGPPAALAAGAGWTRMGQATFSSNPDFTVAVGNNQTVTLLFQPLDGWELPNDAVVSVTLGTLTVLNVNYAVNPPRMIVNPAQGIGLIGTTGTVYRIERRASLSADSWVPVCTNTLHSGFNLSLPWPLTDGPVSFYRAVWLP